MSEEQMTRLEEGLTAYRYICMRLEFFEAFVAWMCLPPSSGISSLDKDIQLAHSSLYRGLWVETQPSDEAWPVQIFMGKPPKGLH